MATKMDSKLVAKVLRDLARAIEAGESRVLAEVAKALVTQERLDLDVQNPAPGRTKKASKGVVSDTEGEKIRQKLSDFDSRGDLGRYIEDTYPTKVSLVGVLRKTRVPVNKDDSYEALLEKLIDSMIGYKLRSRAIRGE